MVAIGCYLLFVISFAGMILSNDPFGIKEREKFSNYILNLHNKLRAQHNKPNILQSNSLEVHAVNILMKKIMLGRNESEGNFGVNYYEEIITENTTLTKRLAEYIFSKWTTNYIVSNDPSSGLKDEAKQILWANTKYIGFAIMPNKTRYSVLAIYSPRYDPTIREQSVSNDQGGPSTI